MTNLEKQIEQLRVAKPDIIDFIKKNDLNSLAYFCSCTMFSVVVAYHYVLEDFPEHKDECEKKIKALKEFYGYE